MKRSRWAVVVVAVCLVVTVAAVAYAAGKATAVPVQEVVRARRFEVVDSAGKVVADLGAQSGTVPFAIAVMAISVIGAIIAARITARATIKGSREQAIETERVRLRYDVAKRRIREFDHAAMALEQYLREQAEQLFQGFDPLAFRVLAQPVGLTAMIVAGKEVATDVSEFFKACNFLSSALSTHEQSHANPEPVCSEVMDSVTTHLYRLKSMIDDAAMKRLENDKRRP